MRSFKRLSEEKKELERAEKRWSLEKPLIERRNQLLKEQSEIKKQKQKLTTSKLLILFLFGNCSIIELFTGWTTVKMLNTTAYTGLIDFSPLIALIGAVVSEVFGYAVYALKSAKENTTGGIVYDMAIQNIDNPPSPPDTTGVG